MRIKADDINNDLMTGPEIFMQKRLLERIHLRMQFINIANYP